MTELPRMGSPVHRGNSMTTMATRVDTATGQPRSRKLEPWGALPILAGTACAICAPRTLPHPPYQVGSGTDGQKRPQASRYISLTVNHKWNVCCRRRREIKTKSLSIPCKPPRWEHIVETRRAPLHPGSAQHPSTPITSSL